MFQVKATRSRTAILGEQRGGCAALPSASAVSSAASHAVAAAVASFASVTVPLPSTGAG
jgi:hypothetical protein